MAYVRRLLPIRFDAGLTSLVPKRVTNDGRLAALQGLRYSSNHPGISAQPGWRKYGNLQAAGRHWQFGHDWWPTPTTHSIISFDNSGSFRIVNYGTGVYTLLGSITTVFSQTNWSMVEGGKETAAAVKKLFIFGNPTNIPSKIEGNGTFFGTINSAALPPEWTGVGTSPTCGAAHEGRIACAGHFESFGNIPPHLVYFSTPTNHENYTGAGSLSMNVFPGEGEIIAGLISFQSALIVFKYPKGVYAINTADPNTANWKMTRISQNVGGAGPNCAAVVDDTVVFMDPNGDVYQIYPTGAFGDFNIRSLTKLAQFSDGLDSLLSPRMRFITCNYNQATRELFFVLPTNVNTLGIPANVVMIDFNGEDPRFIIQDISSSGAAVTALWTALDSDNKTIVMGGVRDNGLEGIYKINYDPFTGSPDILTRGLFRTVQTDFAPLLPDAIEKRKSSQFLEIVYSNSMPAASDLEVRIAWDSYNYTLVKTISVPAGTPSETIKRTRIRLTGGGFLFSVELAFRSGVTVHAVYLNAAINDERII